MLACIHPGKGSMLYSNAWGALFIMVRAFGYVSYLFQRIVCGNFGQEGVCAGGVVDVATVVGEAVGDYDIGHTKDTVVAYYLVEYVLRNGYMGGFVLDEHLRIALRIVHHSVTTTRHIVECERYFIAYATGRIAKMPHQIGYKVLTNPLLGCEYNVSTTHTIPDGYISIGIATQAIGVGGQIELYHLCGKNLRVSNLMCNFTQNYIKRRFCANNEVKLLQHGKERCKPIS